MSVKFSPQAFQEGGNFGLTQDLTTSRTKLGIQEEKEENKSEQSSDDAFR